MNRFRKSKKAKEHAENQGGAASPGFSLKPSKKKVAPEPKPEFDLSAALPPTDNFRTSLLMPKLSARFSMLKEQDDPLSMLGKASDDSVLFPKRASRLNLFGHDLAALTDIDETCSNDGSRPSLALDRTGSFVSGGDGYGTDDDRSHGGSMMSRGRRTEGNNLFGGRQKTYKIPVRSPVATTPDTSDAPRWGMGKPLSDSNMNLSAFQRLRLKEKEEKTVEAARESEYAASTASSTSRARSSSTASGPLSTVPSLTTATSADELPNASHSSVTAVSPPETLPGPMYAPRNGSTRNRRLYGQGLTQAAQSQQSSTLDRLESLSRQRAGTVDLPSLDRNYSRSATNLRERLQNLAVVELVYTSQATSPPSSATSPKPRMSGEAAPRDRPLPAAATFGAPPLSPPISENDEFPSLLAASIHPEDHGKATAMGLFNRPATGFDEQAFSRRQLEMHQGRKTPPPRRASPPRRPLPAEPAGRTRGLSKSSYGSRAESASSHYTSDAHCGIDNSCASSVEASPFKPGVKNFYAKSTASGSGDEGGNPSSRELSSATSLVTEYGPPLQHSGVASNKPPTTTEDHLETLPEVRYSDLGDLRPINENDLDLQDSSSGTSDNTPKRPDSPTLEPDHGYIGVGKMIISHLRQQSDKSSIFPPPSPRPAQQQSGTYIHKTDTPKPPTGVPMIAEPREESRPSSTIRPGTSSSQSLSGNSAEGTASRNSAESFATGTYFDTASVSNGSSWREELELRHRRHGSTETQREREEFAIELAERRRKVQEKLRIAAESESRSSSPTPGRSTPDLFRAGNAFAMLKQKSSKQASTKPDQKKLFGYVASNASTSTLSPEELWREEERPCSNFSRHPNSSSPQIGSERSLRSRMPSLSRDNSYEDSCESNRSRGSSPFADQRDRAGSDAPGRSKSRTRLHDRDDLQTVDEGSIIGHDSHNAPDDYEASLPVSRPTSSRPSTEMSDPANLDRTSSIASGRNSSTSRSDTPSFQYERSFQFSQSNTSSIIGASPRPPPAAPAYSANATPPLDDMPTDGSSISMVSSSNNSQTSQRGLGQGSLMKRPVNKKQISEPLFVSSTSSVSLVGLSPGSALPSPGSAPPVPPMNPRRRRGTTTQTILGAFKSDKNDLPRVASPVPSVGDEYSIFPDEEKRPRSRSRLRKISSEGGNLNARARQGSITNTLPAVPQYPPPAIPVDGGMF
ncbi:ATPase, F1/V1/A1 complex, alpha/beta subunit, nucleotide-binding domain, active site [Penicillium digitatum]|uniref:Uncharacterized protein n=3 Tax=Penicillium digitatum TaxID=36651 RepID=K9G217_PEND2|nr:hypothetical protein PDIP_64340 [Penicillium digitatum Pd1]EKV09471.1 hypothetical protein PDIP_64340 [Penicillium digitatum Pd1]EKV14917.1 hypothetical protein PDIG_29960 [Penicillium digitatum PHI26]KAG0157049.1 hypothetical protein PDIDSM_4233 [Penicillium digitatum]QQK44624.1 ATPase, F1/V1/A1 complex, alpha/beta subunit, nucleotide-binding domain, active site [Penicillium digitatum]